MGDVLRVPLKKDCIPGYSGYLGGIRETYGIGWRKSVIASKNIVDEGKESQDDELFSLHGDEKETLNQQYFGERLKLKRRYAAAIKRLNASGSTQEQLLKVMQSKLQERVSSNSSQVAKLKMVLKISIQMGPMNLMSSSSKQGAAISMSTLTIHKLLPYLHSSIMMATDLLVMTNLPRLLWFLIREEVLRSFQSLLQQLLKECTKKNVMKLQVRRRELASQALRLER